MMAFVSKRNEEMVSHRGVLPAQCRGLKQAMAQVLGQGWELRWAAQEADLIFCLQRLHVKRGRE